MRRSRTAFLLVDRVGAWIIFIDSDLSVGGSGLPKPPHVHVKQSGKQYSFWLRVGLVADKEVITIEPRAGNLTDGDAKHAKKLAYQYRQEALDLYRQHIEQNIQRNATAEYIPDVAVVEWEPSHHLVLLVDSTEYLVDFHRFPIFRGADELEIHDCEAFGEDWIHWFGLDADILLESLLAIG